MDLGGQLSPSLYVEKVLSLRLGLHLISTVLLL